MKSNKRNYFAALVLLLVAGLFSSCIIVTSDDSKKLENFRFLDSRTLVCDYSGYVTSNNIESVRIRKDTVWTTYSKTNITVTCENSRVTFLFSKSLTRGDCVEIKFTSALSNRKYEVTY